MKLITPTIDLFYQDGKYDHLARCARVCYASEKTTNNEEFYNKLIERKHFSMLRHISYYFIINKDDLFYKSIVARISSYRESPYINYRIDKNSCYVSTNGQFIYENELFYNMISNWEVDTKTFCEKCPFKDLYRITICVTTHISTTRELNRVSPNNIAEQSTRYVNFGKKGGIGIAVPHFYHNLSPYRRFICRLAWRIYEYFYNKALKWGLPAQDAREFLPLTSYSKAVYTYTLKEWKHILDLRYFGTTGKPHPNAYNIASHIYNLFKLNELI